MGVRFFFFFCAILSLDSWAGSQVDGIYCTGPRKFQSEAKTSFDYRATRFSLPNAYWLALAAFDSYSEEKPLLDEFRRWGFRDEADPSSHHHLTFISRDAVASVELLGNQFTVPYADSQVLWAESADGVILAFRGTTGKVTGDLVTNLRLFPQPTRLPGKVHLGFYGALRVIWKDLYRKLIDLRRRDLADKRQILDRLAHLEDAERDQQAALLADWKIPVEGRIRFLREWKRISDSLELNQSAKLEKLDDLLNFLNVNWKSHQKPIWITGHSLGGGLAQIATQRMLDQGFNVAGLYTFGSPRAGNETFAHEFEVKAKDLGIRENIVRFVNGNDLVARVPPATGLISQLELDEGWRHVGRLKYFSPRPLSEGSPELYTDYREGLDIPKYVKDLEGEPSTWLEDHKMEQYAEKLEHIVFGNAAPCDP